MAIIRNTASMMLKGRVGATTYYVADSRQLARQAMNNSNYGENASRTDLQQARRVKWSNLVNFYSGNKAWMKKAYENLDKGVSIFNRFMQLNINTAKVALTKAQAQAKTWAVAPYRVTQGSLPTLPVAQSGPTNSIEIPGIAVLPSGVEPGDTMNLGQLSQALINGDFGFADGDALVIVLMYGTTKAPSTGELKTASYKYYEIVLDSSSEAALPLADATLVYNSAALKFTLMTGNIEAAAVIHTRKSAGKLLVSTQDIFVSMEANEAWRSSAQFREAINSYGESSTVPLAPGGSSEFGTGNDSSTGGGGDDDESGSLG